MSFISLTVISLLFATSAFCLPQYPSKMDRRDGPSPYVFAHYMLIMQPPNGDYTDDIGLAKAAGIDAFAVNYGGWNVDWAQQEGFLAKFYQTAEAQDFKLFLSIDTTSVNDTSMIIRLTNTYADSPAQFRVDGKVVLSSFQTNPPAWNWKNDVLDQIGSLVLFLPGTLSDAADQLFGDDGMSGDGPFTWIHPTKTVDDEHATDISMASARTSNNKLWMAGIAPWFFKQLSADMNWAQAQDDGIFVDRWLSLLSLKPDFIEIITWNDWSESSYIGPPDSAPAGTTDVYWADKQHCAFRNISKPLIKAFKAGQTTVTVEEADEGVYFFYRIQPAAAQGTNDPLPLPTDAENLKDEVFVITLLSAPATVTLTSGSAMPVTWTAPAGLEKTAHEWSLGAQTLKAVRGNATIADKTGPAIVSSLEKYDGNVVAI